MYPDEMVLPEDSGAVTREPALERVDSGGNPGFDELFDRYRSMVFTLAYRILGDREEALDIAQDVFLTVYTKLESFRGDSSVKTWIYSIAVRRASNRFRWWNRLRRRGTVSLEEHLSRKPGPDYSTHLKSAVQSPEEALVSLEERQQMERRLEALPSEQRIAVVLRDIEGLTYEEIAESMQISLGTVKSRIARGREMLKHHFIKKSVETGGRHVV